MEEDSLQLLIGCSPANPTMVGCEGKVQESSSCFVLRLDAQLVFRVRWDLKEAGAIPVTEWTCQRGKQQIKGVPSCLKTQSIGTCA